MLSLIMSHCTYNVYMTPMYWMCCEYTYMRTTWSWVHVRTYQSHAFGWRTQSPTSASSSNAVQTNSQHTSHHVKAPTYVPWHCSTPSILKGYSRAVNPITYRESNKASPTHKVWLWIGIHKIWRTYIHDTYVCIILTYILYVSIIHT